MNFGDIFTIGKLTAAINDLVYQPRRLGEMGLFQEEGITTTSVLVEREGDTLALVPSAERGAPGTPIDGDKRKGVTFNAVHLPTTATILAAEAQNTREFGTEDALQGVEALVNKRLAKMARFLEVTHEYQRIGAVKGQVLDSDGSTVLFDLFTAFDMSQGTKAMVLGTATTKVQVKCLEVLEMIETALDGAMFDGVSVLCGSTFWGNLIGHELVAEAYKYQSSLKLREDGREAFDFGGLSFERYRGGVGGSPFVAAGVAYAIPRGVEDMFITRYAPADYTDAVNTIGLPLYASSEELRHNKGFELEAQSNPIHLNTRPSAVIKLT